MRCVFYFFYSYKKATSASKLMPAKSAIAFCYNIQLLKQKQNGVDINKGDVHIFSLPSLFQGYLSVRGATRLKYLLSWKTENVYSERQCCQENNGPLVEDSIMKLLGTFSSCSRILGCVCTWIKFGYVSSLC